MTTVQQRSAPVLLDTRPGIRPDPAGARKENEMSIDGDAFDLTGQTALVTGAATGIGKAISTVLARRGARIVLVDRSDAATATAAALGANHIPLIGDAADPASVERIVAEAEARTGGIDILVNNAGIVRLGPAIDLSIADWDATMAINLRAPFLFARLLGRHMCTRGRGRIVNIASQAASIALDQHAAYCASKAGILGLTRVLALEWGPHGVNTNAISPTVVETELGKKAWAGEVGERFKQLIPTRRFAQPDEVAHAVLYLVSAAAGMVNGENLVIDGGFSIA